MRGGGSPWTAPYTGHSPPQFKACKHWLEVRCPEKWSLRRKPAAEVLDELIRQQATQRSAAFEAVCTDPRLAALDGEGSAKTAGTAQTSRNIEKMSIGSISDCPAETCQ